MLKKCNCVVFKSQFTKWLSGIFFLQGALISLCEDDYIHLWNLRQAQPALVQSLRFNREKWVFCKTDLWCSIWIISYSLHLWLLAALMRNNLNEYRCYREVIHTFKLLISYHTNPVIGGSLQGALDRENSQHFTMPHLVSLWNDIWGTSAEIPIDVEDRINIPLS